MHMTGVLDAVVVVRGSAAVNFHGARAPHIHSPRVGRICLPPQNRASRITRGALNPVKHHFLPSPKRNGAKLNRVAKLVYFLAHTRKIVISLEQHISVRGDASIHVHSIPCSPLRSNRSVSREL